MKILLCMVAVASAACGCAAVERVDLESLARKRPAVYAELRRAVALVNSFIRERPFFTTGYDVERASLEIRDNRIRFNERDLVLARGSAVLTLGRLTGIFSRTRPRANATPERISFGVFDCKADALSYDEYRKGRFIQQADISSIAQILVHELTHVVQFRRDGATWFYGKYVVSFLCNVFYPLTYFGRDSGPYMRIGYEMEARRYESAMHQECRKVFEEEAKFAPGR